MGEERDAIEFIVVGVDDEEKVALPFWNVQYIRTLRWNGDWQLAVCALGKVYMVTANGTLRRVVDGLRTGRSVEVDADGRVTVLDSE